MRLVRGSLPEPGADNAVTRRLAVDAASSGVPALRVWTPPPQAVFGRRDAAEPGYARARRLARERGYPSRERSVGGRAVVHTGTTVAVAHVVPDADRVGIDDRYEAATRTLRDALATLGVDARPGEPEGTFCPGTHSLQRDGKIAGLAQRVRADCALLGGYVVVTSRDEAAVARVLEPVYAALDVAFDPDAVGSVEGAGGRGDVEAAVAAVERAFLSATDGEPEELSAGDILA